MGIVFLSFIGAPICWILERFVVKSTRSGFPDYWKENRDGSKAILFMIAAIIIALLVVLVGSYLFSLL